MNFFGLTLKSMVHRRLSVSLTFLTLLISCVLLISVSKLQTSVRASFERTISGVDLIVGPESGPVTLLLYSMFRMGDPLVSINYDIYQKLKNDPRIAWALPLSMGDSHKGYRVLGTSVDYFDHYQLGDGETLEFAGGAGESLGYRWDHVVIGSTVAQELGYSLGEHITISHGTGEVSFEEHTNLLFEIVGILEPTGTSVDRSLHIALEGLEAVHAGWNNVAEVAAAEKSPELKAGVRHDFSTYVPEQISVLLLSLESKLTVFEVQSEIQKIPGYQAILPGVAFQQFWQIIEICERILQIISLLVFFCTLTGMVCAMITSLTERRREIAILRSLGGSPRYVAGLLLSESSILIALAAVGGWLVSVMSLGGAAEILSSYWGIYLHNSAVFTVEWSIVFTMVALGVLAGLLPAALAYRESWTVSLSTS